MSRDGIWGSQTKSGGLDPPLGSKEADRQCLFSIDDASSRQLRPDQQGSESGALSSDCLAANLSLTLTVLRKPVVELLALLLALYMINRRCCDEYQEVGDSE